MSISDKKLPFSGNALLLEKLAINYTKFADSNAIEIPKQQIYKIVCEDESPKIERSARKHALASIEKSSGFTKVAIDSRRIDQCWDRNPRPTIQFFTRSQPFIDEKDQGDINVFAKLMNSLIEIKASYGDQPEYFESYARVLYDNVERILRLKQGDLEIYRPQLEYLKQLIYARYRLSMDNIVALGNNELKDRILSKDENLIKRGLFLKQTEDPNKKTGNIQNKKIIEAIEEIVPLKKAVEVESVGINKNTEQAVQQYNQSGIAEAIFGNNIRKPGEKNSSRTITITIKESGE